MSSQNDQLKAAVETMRKGGVILCPSDTIASLSCDATNMAAIERIFEIKQRPKEKRMIILVSSYTMLEGYIDHIPESAYQLMDISEEPLTIIYPEVRNLPELCLADDGSVAIRLVKGGFMQKLIERFRKPVISTSANISDQPAPMRVSEVSEAISNKVDRIVGIEEYRTKPSSILKFNADGSFKIIRK